MDSNGFPSPIFVVNYRLVTTEGPLHCALKAIKHASETCKDIYAFEWHSLTIFCGNFVLSFYVYHSLKVHSTVLVPLLSNYQTH